MYKLKEIVSKHSGKIALAAFALASLGATTACVPTSGYSSFGSYTTPSHFGREIRSLGLHQQSERNLYGNTHGLQRHQRVERHGLRHHQDR